MKRTARYSVAALAAITALGLSPLLQARGPGHGHGKHGKLKRMIKELDLSEAQQAQVKELRKTMKADLEDERAALETKRQELHALWMADTPDADAILAKHAEMDPLRSEVRAQRVKMKIEVYKLLTPEQQARFKKLKAERKKKHIERRHKMKDRMGGMGGELDHGHGLAYEGDW